MSRRNRKPKIYEKLELEIDALSHDGRGLALREGKRVFVEGALTEERVLAEVRRKKSRFEEATTLEVIKSSRQRVEPRCAQADRCGGCSLQHLESGAQIDLKQSTLLQQLEHFGGLSPDRLLPVMQGSDFNYRRKARLGVRYVAKREEVLVGFREKGSSFITDIKECHILDERVGGKIVELRELIAGLSVYRAIPQIEVAVGDDTVALVFRHVEPLLEEDIEQLVSFGKSAAIDIYLQPGGLNSVHKIWPADGVERLQYRLPDFDLEMQFHPMDFTQVNQSINQQAVSLAVSLLDPQQDERVLDLFCGLGNFTLPLARSAAQVIGVEGSDEMVRRGFENARHNSVDNVEFYAADLTQEFSEQSWAQQGFDKMLIDPPRSGALEIVKKMARFAPKRIVYVSCNPATLARDAGELKNLGYHLSEAGVMDMFPHTTHVESIAVFNREPVSRR